MDFHAMPAGSCLENTSLFTQMVIQYEDWRESFDLRHSEKNNINKKYSRISIVIKERGIKK
jgi:hypothetical protein